MDRCQDCQNILPRTVDRCPVCGHDNASANIEAVEAPDAQAHGRDFLEALNSKGRGRAKPSVSSPRSGRTPTRLGHDGATPLYEEKSSAEDRASDFELPDLATETRTVAAISSRLNSNIKIGRKRSHALLVGVAGCVALGSLGAGTIFGLQRTEVPEQIAMSSLNIPVNPGDSPLVATASVQGFDPLALVSITEPNSCAGPVRATGIVVEGGTIVAPIGLTEQADAPTIAFGDETTVADIIGLSNTNDIAVMRPTDRLEGRLRIATSTTVRVGTRVSLVTINDGQATLSPAQVTRFETRDAAVHAFAIGTDFANEDQLPPEQSYSRGTIVLDNNGDLLGMAGNDGLFVTAQRISETTSKFQASPDFPNPVCS